MRESQRNESAEGSNRREFMKVLGAGAGAIVAGQLAFGDDHPDKPFGELGGTNAFNDAEYKITSKDFPAVISDPEGYLASRNLPMEPKTVLETVRRAEALKEDIDRQLAGKTPSTEEAEGIVREAASRILGEGTASPIPFGTKFQLPVNRVSSPPSAGGEPLGMRFQKSLPGERARANPGEIASSIVWSPIEITIEGANGEITITLLWVIDF